VSSVTTKRNAMPRLDDWLRRRLERAVRQGAADVKADRVRSQMHYGNLDALWRVAWRQRHASLASFEPGMRALVIEARHIEAEQRERISGATQ